MAQAVNGNFLAALTCLAGTACSACLPRDFSPPPFCTIRIRTLVLLAGAILRKPSNPLLKSARPVQPARFEGENPPRLGQPQLLRHSKSLNPSKDCHFNLFACSASTPSSQDPVHALPIMLVLHKWLICPVCMIALQARPSARHCRPR